jgi:hypothetical protein
MDEGQIEIGQNVEARRKRTEKKQTFFGVETRGLEGWKVFLFFFKLVTYH